MSLFNYIVIEEADHMYLRSIYGGFIGCKDRQLVTLRKNSILLDIRDMEITNFKNNKRYCFIVGGRIYQVYGNYLLAFLRARYQDCKIICVLTDLLRTHPIVAESLRENFDDVIVFIQSDSMRYGFKYFRLPYEYEPIPQMKCKYDFFFAGSGDREKGRWDDIRYIFLQLKNRGFKCKFFVPNVPYDLRIEDKDLIFNNIPFNIFLEYMMASKCLVEVVQKDMDSPTIRLCEAALYGKHLLTNCSSVLKDPLYTDITKIVHLISDDIDYGFIEGQIDLDAERIRWIFSNDCFIEEIERSCFVND